MYVQMLLSDVKCEVFTAVKIQVVVLWVVTPCPLIGGYQHAACIFRIEMHDPEDANYMFL